MENSSMAKEDGWAASK
ncbi:MAG: hypothetical protein LKI84_09190 [Lactococcus lactis]|nr:hypothetical protein [Lactococcus lactis]